MKLSVIAVVVGLVVAASVLAENYQNFLNPEISYCPQGPSPQNWVAVDIVQTGKVWIINTPSNFVFTGTARCLAAQGCSSNMPSFAVKYISQNIKQQVPQVTFVIDVGPSTNGYYHGPFFAIFTNLFPVSER